MHSKRGEMSESKKFATILRGDKKLFGMFGGIVLNVVILVAILVTFCLWHLP
jgi:hypothetical protein